jgi:aspartate kinase
VQRQHQERRGHERGADSGTAVKESGKVTVAKFGGTSLANAENIKKVCAIIRDDPARKIIVVSAPGRRTRDDIKLTDLLFQISELESKKESFDLPFLKFQNRFLAIEREFGLKTDLAATMQEFYNEIPGANIDFITSTGEYFMAKIMASILGFTFLDIDKSAVIVFDKNGAVDLEKSKANFAPFIGKNLVVPGFYGVSCDGKIKTFTRGGSDITGAVIANLAGAALYENWTDVDGVFDRDPNKFPDAKKFDHLSYDEIESLARAGANVLHPDCISFVRSAQIPIRLCNTFNPSAPGTLIN